MNEDQNILTKIKYWGIKFLYLVLVVFISFTSYRYIKSLSTDIERIEIVISDKKLAFLDSLRDDVLETKKIKNSHKQYVKALLVYQGDSMKIKIRLKGDKLDHFRPYPPSYGVKILKNKNALGNYKLSFQGFGARRFLKEWIFLKMMEQENILSLNSGVVDFSINGHQTVCTFEGHFTHHITDRFDRPRGPIICITEDALWNDMVLNDSVKFKNEKHIYSDSPIKVFMQTVPLDSNHVDRAVALLDDFRKSRKTASEVFDIKRLATHIAISELSGAHHGLRWHNRRFYYNPSTDRLEPIGFDGQCRRKMMTKFIFDDTYLKCLKWSNLFLDKEFVEMYTSELKRISSAGYLEDFFNKNKDEISQVENQSYHKNLFFIRKQEYLHESATWVRNNLADYKKRLLTEISNTPH
ncbi:MAG: hypothetical protein HRT72_02015 [Flavobacteriales bacterium]|nr:hypothetical protein [Flavobacteriales bacterium]